MMPADVSFDVICRNGVAAVWATLGPQDISSEDLRRRYEHWFASGNGGALGYIDERLNSICDPFGVRPWARSALIVAFSASVLSDSPLTGLPKPREGHPVGSIAGYALREDYHVAGRRVLEEIAAGLTREWGVHRYEVCVDSSPVPEKDMAIIAGIGVGAPNSLVRVSGHGCRMHLGVMFTSLDLPWKRVIPEIGIPCSDCMACRRECPNHAMTSDGTLIVRRCRSWIAGQKRGALDWNEQLALGGSLFGCSICSSRCAEDSQGDDDLLVDALELLRMPTGVLGRIIARTPLNHSGVAMLRRNAAAAVGVQSTGAERRALQEELLSKCGSAIVSDTISAWQ